MKKVLIILVFLSFIFLPKLSFSQNTLENEFLNRYKKVNPVSLELSKTLTKLDDIRQDLEKIAQQSKNADDIRLIAISSVKIQLIETICFYENQLLVVSVVIEKDSRLIYFNEARKRIDFQKIKINEHLYTIRSIFTKITDNAALHLLSEAKGTINLLLTLLDRCLEAVRQN